MKIGKNFQSWGFIDGEREDIITIGDNVVLGRGSDIITHCPVSFYNGKDSTIVIGNNVYIGARCIILPGAKIGNNVVIGAGSVVAGSIPGNVVAAGNPCCVIRKIDDKEADRIERMTIQKIVGNGRLPA